MNDDPARGRSNVILVSLAKLAAHPISWSQISEGKAKMANGWAPDGAVQDQIEDSIKDAILAARARMPAGEGQEECEQCGDEIPLGRRRALPGVRTCIFCQSQRDARPLAAGINRRGSKDSQLR